MEGFTVRRLTALAVLVLPGLLAGPASAGDTVAIGVGIRSCAELNHERITEPDMLPGPERLDCFVGSRVREREELGPER